MLGKIRNVITHHCLIVGVCKMLIVIVVMIIICLLMNNRRLDMGGVNKFKVGDVVKCVDAISLVSITTGKEYVLVEVSNDCGVKVENDMGEVVYYYSYRFELSNSDETSQPHKFKEGDMVYLIGFNHFKPCKLTLSNCEYPPLLVVVMDGDGYETFTENGCYTTEDVEPSLVLATEENRLMLNKLLGVEYEPLKLTGSDLAKKLLKDKPQTCYVSDVSDEYALSIGGVVLIMEFENDRFISKMGTGWKFAVPCNQHGNVLEDE